MALTFLFFTIQHFVPQKKGDKGPKGHKVRLGLRGYGDVRSA